MPRCKTRARKAIARRNAEIIYQDAESIRRNAEIDRRRAEIDDHFKIIVNAPTSEKRIEAMDGIVILLKRIAPSGPCMGTYQDKLCYDNASGKESQEDVETTMALIAEIVKRCLGG